MEKGKRTKVLVAGCQSVPDATGATGATGDDGDDGDDGVPGAIPAVS